MSLAGHTSRAIRLAGPLCYHAVRAFGLPAINRRLRDAGLKIRQAREAVIAVPVLNEQVIELQEFVVGTDRHRVAPANDGEIVGELGDVLIQFVRL